MTAVHKTESDAPTRPGWVSVPKASRALDRAPATILTDALRGDLEWQVADGRVFITDASIERFRQKLAAASTEPLALADRASR